MVVSAMQGANRHIRSRISILPKDTLTYRRGKSNQRPSHNKILALLLSHSHHHPTSTCPLSSLLKKNNDYRHIPLASVVIVIWVPSAVPPRSHHHATPGPNAVFLLSQLVLRKYSEHVPSPHPLVSAPLKIYARILFWSILTSAFIILAQLQEKFSKLSLKWQGLQVNHRLPVWLDSSAWNQEKI